MEVHEVHHVVVVGQDEVLEVGDLDLGGRPRAAVRVRAGVAALAHAAVLEVPVPVWKRFGSELFSPTVQHTG